MAYKCEKCNRKFFSEHNFNMHRIFKHHDLNHIEKKLLWYGFLTGILSGLIISAIFAIANPYIQKTWDESRGIKPDIYISLNQILVSKSKNLLDLSNESKRLYFLNWLEETHKKDGLIPLPFRHSFVFTILNPEENTTACMIPFYEIPDNERRLVTLTIPNEETKNLCEGCILVLLYGANKGNKTIDYLNIRTDFDDDVYVKENIQGKDLEICGNNCIRLKRNLIGNEESFLGSFLIKKYNTKVFDDNEIKQFTGRYSTWGIESDIPSSHMTKILSFVILNCTTDKSFIK